VCTVWPEGNLPCRLPTACHLPAASLPLQEGVNAALAQLAAGNCSPSINQVEEQGCLAAAMAAGASLAAEQQAVLDTRLSQEYVRGLEADRKLASERSARWRRSAASAAARRVAAAQAAEELRRAAADVVRSEAAAAVVAGGDAAHVFASSQQQQQQQQEEEEKEEEEAEAGPPPTASGLPPICPDELWAATRSGGVRVLDVRSAREWDWGRIKGAIHTPIVLAAGPATNPAAAKLNPGFMEAATAALGSPAAAPPIVLYGPGTPLHSQAAAAYVSKEQFVSIAPTGAGRVEGQVRLKPGLLAFVDNRGACGIGQS
jgi:rhodanese-related sulfurtransferase